MVFEDMLQFSDTSTFLVLISTCNRAGLIKQALESVLANDYPNFEICVVDQSDNDLTEKAIQPFLKDKRIYYLHTQTKGLSIGRNIGIASSSIQNIAITDDDCVVPTDWLSQMNQAFKRHPKIGAVFGNVIAGDYDHSAGFIPTYIRQEPFLAYKIQHRPKIRGIGACMGLKREAWEAVHHFDQMLGSGAPFKSSSEGDLINKLLLAGYSVYETPQVKVTHNGFRSWKQGRPLAHRNWFGMGSIDAKYFKLKKWFILREIILTLCYRGFGQIISDAFHKRIIRGFTPVISYFQGFLAGLMRPIDKTTYNYFPLETDKIESINKDNARSSVPLKNQF